MATFLESITPPPMIQRLEELCASHSDLQALMYILTGEQKLVWLHCLGVCSDEELKSFSPPLPPQHLRSLTAAPELENFLWTGVMDLYILIDLYQRYKHPNASAYPTIFDFGCGCGRLTRFLNNRQKFNVFASDVHPDLVQWCRDNLDQVTTLINNPSPPLPFKDAYFDFIYSISIFTHLSEQNTELWLEELARVLAPNGILMVTTHGHPALDIIKNSVVHQNLFNFEENSIQQIVDDFEKHQFRFYSYPTSALELAKAGDEYGNSFIPPDYIETHWNNQHLKVLSIIPGGLRGWQDIIILQRQ